MVTIVDRLFVAMLVFILSSATAFAADEQRNRWQAEGWYGYTTFSDGHFFSCDAAFDYGNHLALRLGRIAARCGGKRFTGEREHGWLFEKGRER